MCIWYKSYIWTADKEYNWKWSSQLWSNRKTILRLQIFIWAFLATDMLLLERVLCPWSLSRWMFETFVFYNFTVRTRVAQLELQFCGKKLWLAFGRQSNIGSKPCMLSAWSCKTGTKRTKEKIHDASSLHILASQLCNQRLGFTAKAHLPNTIQYFECSWWSHV